jgi:hypothetical protein
LIPSTELRKRLLRSATLLILAGCASVNPAEEPSSGVFFPTWHQAENDPTPGGLLAGKLVLKDDCLLWDADEQGVLLALWPDRFTLRVGDQGPQIDLGDGRVLRVGDEGMLGGGQRTLAQATDLTSEEIPEQCQASGYWMADSFQS